MTATHKLNKIDNEYGDIGFQARIIQGRETPHFLQLFKGKLIIFKGKGTDYDGTKLNIKHFFFRIKINQNCNTYIIF